MNSFIGCEFSGKVRNEFRKRDHNAWSCDLLSTESKDYSVYHLEGNIFKFLKSETFNYDKWDILIAFPPGTYLCNSGVRWLYNKDGTKNYERWKKMKEGALFFKKLLNCKINKICIENPIPHKYALEIIGKKYDQIIQPYQYGHVETKATCLWLKNLPLLQSTNIVNGRGTRINRMSSSKNGSKLRSITYSGIAKAMAEQWGE